MDDFVIGEAAWQQAEDYARLPYLMSVAPEETTGGGLSFVARHPELPGCVAHGDTPDEAVENLAESRRLYIASLIEDGEVVPVPARPVAGQWIITRIAVSRPTLRGVTVAVRSGSRRSTIARRQNTRLGGARIVHEGVAIG